MTAPVVLRDDASDWIDPPIPDRPRPALAQAADRELRKRSGDNPPPNTPELDARGLAKVVWRHWGDDAPRILARALALCTEARDNGD